RVSTADQAPALQVTALEAAGCEHVVTEHASGGKRERPELQALLSRLAVGDVVVVWKLDRLSRSLKDLLWILERVEDAGAGFHSVTESINTTTPAGRMLMQMLGAFAEFERAMIRERTLAGLEAAKRKGRRLGPRFKLTTEQQDMVIELLEGGRSQREVARLFGVGQATISRLWQRRATNQVYESRQPTSERHEPDTSEANHKRTSVNQEV
ncbi:MAG: DNA invertase Pin-like site-specific DNA recombinase, partial [Myxococcota bacterium]